MFRPVFSSFDSLVGIMSLTIVSGIIFLVWTLAAWLLELIYL